MRFSLRNVQFLASLVPQSAGIDLFPMVTDGLLQYVESSDFDALAADTVISTWSDKTAFGRDWTTAASSQPGPTVDQTTLLNGHATVRFTGASNQGLAVPNFTQPGYDGLEMFCVVKMLTNTLGGPIVNFTRATTVAYTSHHSWIDNNFYEAFGRTDRPAEGIPGTATGQTNGSYIQQFAVYNVAVAATNNAYDAYMHTSSVIRPFYSLTSGYTFISQGAEATNDHLHTMGYGNWFGTGSWYWWDGNLAAIYLYNRRLSAVERQQMLYYLDYKWNFTVEGWARRVVTNGGAAPSEATKTALRTLWLGCMAQNLPAKLKSVNGFAPDDLTAAITPLVNIWGNDPYTSVNFVSGDISADGLKGNASNKYLNTGILPNLSLAQNDAGITLYSATNTATGRYDSGYTANTGDPSFFLAYGDSAVSNQARFSAWDVSTSGLTAANPGFGYLSGSRTGANSIALYWATAVDAHTQLALSSAATTGTPAGNYFLLYAINAYQSGNPYPYGYADNSLGFFALHTSLTEAESAYLSGLVMAYRFSFMAITVPASVELVVGVPTAIAATAVGLQGHTGSYQWLKDGTPLADDSVYSGTDTATLTVTAADLTALGNYVCRVTVAAVSATSDTCAALMDSGLLLNGSFETPDVSGYQYSPAGSSWTFSGNVGFTDGGAPWVNGAVKDGSQCAFTQTVCSMEQAVSGFTIGKTYTIAFSGSQRPAPYNGNDVIVSIDDVPILNVTPPSYTAWTDYTVDFTATATSHTLKFSTTNPLGGDHASLVDYVRILTT